MLLSNWNPELITEAVDNAVPANLQALMKTYISSFAETGDPPSFRSMSKLQLVGKQTPIPSIRDYQNAIKEGTRCIRWWFGARYGIHDVSDLSLAASVDEN